MKIICAWCGSAISINCNHCGAPLLATNYAGGTFEPDAMVCLNGETPLIYTQGAIDRMEISHGLCQVCAGLDEAERDAMLRRRRDADARLPSAEDLDRIVEERETAAAHEASSRAARLPARPAGGPGGPASRSHPKPPQLLQIQEQSKKRGPREVPEAPTTAQTALGKNPPRMPGPKE